MRQNYLVALVIVIFIVIGNYAFTDVSHGKDAETDPLISRTSVDTITPREGIEIGLTIVHVRDSGNVNLAFTSLDSKLKSFDTSSAVLIVDNQRVTLTFKGYHPFRIASTLPTVHELWFSLLDRQSVAKIKEAKSLSIEISTESGIPAKRDLGNEAVLDVKKVLTGAIDK